MPRLLQDRYLRLDGDRACDLATGSEVRLDAIVEGAPCRTRREPSRGGSKRSITA